MLFALSVFLVSAPITANSLLDEMTDLARLAAPPASAYSVGQASSYDRRSKEPGNSDWFANGDAGNFISEVKVGQRTEYLMADLKGPGFVNRIWSANPSGVIRFYFDGEANPRLSAPMADLLQGKVIPLGSPFSYYSARGCNLYFPIPYARSLRITTDDSANGKKPPLYYQVGYRTYGSGMQVESFDLRSLNRATMARTAALLQGRPTPPSGMSHASAPGKRFLEISSTAPRKVVWLAIKLQMPQFIQEPTWDDPMAPHNLLRHTLLEATFDGKRTVSVPVGDFSGAPPFATPYNSFPMSVSPDGTIICRFAMPFLRTAKFELTTVGGARVPATIRAVTAPAPANSLVFHATWRHYPGRTRPFRDMTFLDVPSGFVRYVGSVLHIANPVPDWWGEGDEKIFFDGKSFPDYFGTGTEDYFGYAWSNPEVYERPYHAQPSCGTPGCFGHISNLRWHVLDDLIAKDGLRFQMEIWHWRDVVADFDTTAYWYATTGVQVRRPLAFELKLRELIGPKPVPGAIEGEKMRVVSKSGVGTVENQAGFVQLSGGVQKWFRNGAPGDRLVLEFDAPEAGEFNLQAHLCHAADYGKHKLWINGEPLGEFDFYSPELKWTLHDLGRARIQRTGNRLEVEIVGSNPRAEPKSHMFGLDYILLKPIR